MASSLIHQHAILLKDGVRMKAYKQAIEEVVRQGDTVVDVGCGLGILSFLAIKAGAKHVHAIEVEPETLSYAKFLARHNGVERKMTFHGGLSPKISLGQKADVIISEIFGNFGLNENLLPVIKDARRRLLKKGGRMIPEGIRIWIAPVEYKDWQDTSKLLHNIYGFDALPNSPYIDLGTPSVSIQQGDILGQPQILAEVDLSSVKSDIAKAKLRFRVIRDGTFTGLAGWFDARLTSTTSFSTGPSDLETHWMQGFLPFRSPMSVAVGQFITLTIEIAPDAVPAGLNSVIGYNYDVK